MKLQISGVSTTLQSIERASELPLDQAAQDTLIATGHPDDDPVAKTLGRERLRAVLDGARTLTELERGALALSANDRTHRDSARELGVGERAVNNALQRARRKLAGPAIPSTVTASRVARHAARP